MDIGLMGRARAGKDTTAQLLMEHHDYTRVAFADPLKEMALAIDPWVGPGYTRLSHAVDDYGWEFAKDKYSEVRRVLQHLGLEAVRGVIGDNAWVDLAQRRIATARDAGRSVVVTDVRFPNEVKHLREQGFTLLWIDRPAVKPSTPEHASESTVYPHHADAVVTNDGSVTDLHESIMDTMNALWDERARV